MSNYPNGGPSQWPSPNDPNATQPANEGQPHYYPPSGYAPPPNYQQRPPYNYNPPSSYPTQSYYPNPVITRVKISTRVVAFAIDAFLVSFVANILLTPFRFAPWHYFTDRDIDVSTNIGSLAQLLILGIYATVMTVYFGGTIGKRLMHLKVVNSDGSTPSLNTYLLRYLIGYPISGVVFCLGFLWILWDRQGQGWHDKLANTYVVAA